MTRLRVTLETLAEAIDLSRESTILIACLINLHSIDEVIEIQAFKNGQAVLDLLNRLDRPNADLVVVGLHIALPPCLFDEGKWHVKPILDFMRVVVREEGYLKDVYAYRTPSGRIFADGEELLKEKITSMRSIYQASNANAQGDKELEDYQVATAGFLTRFIAEIYGSKH
ncbi:MULTISPECIES: hypothetical protein [Pseudomonas]|jgi:hypothetical protein|uniref:Uncharacterized protein n=1 Tax=Pseudomonas putida TaxID=303 RepID=A0A7U6RB56_PSEPU|nr:MULTISPECIES: hypothetical protein [Pseudomonas]MDD2122550.1 hypothetical protein [Pseudomonas monteilii]BBU43324.1 hypothetical protein PPTS312_12390 [Pseudomonas putida]